MYELYSYVDNGMSGGPIIMYENNIPYVIGINSQKNVYSETLFQSSGVTTSVTKIILFKQ